MIYQQNKDNRSGRKGEKRVKENKQALFNV